MAESRNSGRVQFRPTGPNETEVRLQLHYDPEGFTENLGAALGLVSERVFGDLQRFKDFIEAAGASTGAWRGEIRGKSVVRDG